MVQQGDENTYNTSSINYINFNQDHTCLSVAFDNGFKIFNCDPFGKCYSQDDGAIGIVEMLFCSSLVAMVGLGEQPSLSPRRLKILNTKRKSTICELTFPTAILSVKMNRKRLIVLLEDQIYIYDINCMKLLHTIDTTPNILGVCALNSNTQNGNCLLAYPTIAKKDTQDAKASFNSRKGAVTIFDCILLQPIKVIEAHKAEINCLSFNPEGTSLATASTKGTIIRVFPVNDSDSTGHLLQFRRGSYPSKINYISFSNDSAFIAVSSSTETIHIFRLIDAERETVGTPITTNDVTAVESTIANDPATTSGGKFKEPHTPNSNKEGFPPSPKSVMSMSSSEFSDLSEIRKNSVARIIRHSSQTLGRKAAEKMGPYLPQTFTSMLKPARNFASVKLPSDFGSTNSNSRKQPESKIISFEESPSRESNRRYSHESVGSGSTTSGGFKFDIGKRATTINIAIVCNDGQHIMVVNSIGDIYWYKMDPIGGGDCVLVRQYTLL